MDVRTPICRAILIAGASVLCCPAVRSQPVDAPTVQPASPSPPKPERTPAEKAALHEALQRGLEEWERNKVDGSKVQGVSAILEPGTVDKRLFGDPEGEPFLLMRYESRERFYGRDNPKTLEALVKLSLLYLNQVRYSKAEPLLQRVLETSERVLGKDHLNTQISILNLASVYRRQGRFAEAEPLLIRGLEDSERIFGSDHPQTLAAMNALAVLYSSEGRNSEAGPLLLRALDRQQRSGHKSDTETINLLVNTAAILKESGDYPKATELLDRARAMSERSVGKRHETTLFILNQITDLNIAEGNFSGAKALVSQVLEANSQDLRALENRAGIFRATSRFRDAQPIYARLARNSESLLGLAHPETIAAYSNLAGDMLRDSTLAPAALAPSRRLAAGVRARRAAGLSSAYSQAQVQRDASSDWTSFSILADAALAAVQRGRKTKNSVQDEVLIALQDALSGAAGRALKELAVRQLADEKQGGLGALVRERQDLLEQWDANAGRLAAAAGDGGDTVKLGSLRAARSDIIGKLESIDSRLRTEFPEYFALVSPQPLDRGATQDLLAPDEAILLEVPSLSGVHVMAISRNAIEWQRTTWPRDAIVGAVERLLWDVGVDIGADAATAATWTHEAEPGYSYDRKTAYALYRQIVAPVDHVLAGKKHVFVVAGGILASIPFGILVTAPPKGSDSDPIALRQTSWFSDAHALTFIPSIESLKFLRGNRAASGRAGSDFAGYGDPDLEGTSETRGARPGRGVNIRSLFQPGAARSSGGIADVAQLRLFARLPGTAVELENMRESLGAPPGSVHILAEATEGAIKSADLSRVGILALATHGVMAGELSGAAEPGLVFTPPTAASDYDDGLLTSSEIAGLRLNADWVILSACNTAAGDGSDGASGLSGLARSFFYAGARNLLVSHWPVRDDAASRLTVETLRLQNEHPAMSRAEALQRSMVLIRNDASHDVDGDTWAHPNAWAPFSLIGDGARAGDPR